MLGKQGMASGAGLPALGLTAVRGRAVITVLSTGKALLDGRLANRNPLSRISGRGRPIRRPGPA